MCAVQTTCRTGNVSCPLQTLTMENENASLQKCLRSLRSAKSDNEKLAAMMFVSKLLKAEDCDSDVRKEIAEAIGFDFLGRLLKTDSAPEGCPRSMYPSLALSVLSAFSQDEAVVSHPGFVKQICQFCLVISTNPSANADDDDVVCSRQMVGNSYDCLHGLAMLNVTALLDANIIPTLCDCFIRKLYGSEKAFSLLVFIVEKCGPQTWADNSVCLQSLMTMLVTEFSQDKEQSKFDLCSKLSSVVTEIPKDAPKPWLPDLLKSLRGIIQSKIDEKQREPTLHLVAALVTGLGLTSLLPPHTEDCKLLLLVVHLVTVEVRMIVEVEDFDQVSRKENLLSSCFTILEQTISYLAEESAVSLESKQVQQLHAALTGAFNGVLFFLSFVARECPDKMLDLVVIGCVRVLGSWLAEETAALRQEVYEALPFLLKISKATFPSVKETDSGDEQVCALQFLLPGLCHLTAEDQSRAILLQEQLQVLLAQYYSYLWSQFTSHHRSQTQIALRTLCGALLNLSVLEADLVKSHPVFTELMSLLCGCVTVLVDSSYSVLLANQVTLGLMIGRHLQVMQAVEKSQMKTFFTSVLTYFRQIHTVMESGGCCKLALTPKYAEVWDDVAELWFLATQAFGSCIPICPELSQAVLNSGWLPKLIKQVAMTTDSRTDSEIRGVYLTLLSQLSRGHPEVRQMILTNGGLELARSSGCAELEETLSHG